MRNRVFMQAAVLALVVASAVPAQEPSEALTPLELATLLEAGLPSAEVATLAETRGVAAEWSERVVDGLARRGATAADIARIEKAATRRGPTSLATVFFDGATGVTWAVPSNWNAGEQDGELVITLADAPVSVTAEVRARALPIDTGELRGRGVTTLNDYHGLRVREIVAKEGAAWTHHGTWTLRASGWTGVHSVFEEVDASRRKTTCLTWFASGDRLLSIWTRIEDPLGNPTHDEIVDDVTAIITGHAPSAVSGTELSRRRHAARHERLLLADGDGRIVSFDRDSHETTILLPPGHDRVSAASAGFVLTTRGGLVEHHRRLRERWSDPTPLHRVDGPVLALDADPLGDGFTVLTRAVDGTPRSRDFDMRGDARELATDARDVHAESGVLHVGDVRVLMPGIVELRTRRTGDGVIVAASRLVGERSELVVLAREGGVLRELLRLATNPDDTSALAVRRGAGEEVYVLAPGAGLCAVPACGGLPVRLVDPGKIRDLCVLP